MINTLKINNFKSIIDLSLDCGGINILIGRPNTGKSNILESLGMYSYIHFHEYGELRDFVRYVRTSNLFYDETINEPVSTKVNQSIIVLTFKDGRFRGELKNDPNIQASFDGGYNQLRISSIGYSEWRSRYIKLYRFKVSDDFPRMESDFLLPPSGSNLTSLLLTNKKLNKLVSDLLRPFELRHVLKPQENTIETFKLMEDVVISYPYSLLSDTLQRVIFYLCSILSNENSTLIFEEPESHAFPYYTKYIAEKIALDTGGNQYFVSTHNPYLLFPILEKAPAEEIRVFITYFGDCQTKVKALSTKEIQKLMDLERDAFFNIDTFLERK